jgi:leucyl/phenylalanyl-tRNA---protein transferase
MPIYRLTRELLFPDPEWANPDGLLALGGDLRQERLLLAYRLGIFPWYERGYPILWWSPPRRCVMKPEGFHVSRSLRRLLRQGRFTVTFDQAFPDVIRACAETRVAQGKGTWITDEMIDAYCALHQSGFAHSVEAWHGGQLAGGIYGISVGRAFFGESMFARVTNASKVAFATLAQRLADWQFTLIDCQITNPHLQRLGAYEISRADFLRRLAEALQAPTRRGKWH